MPEVTDPEILRQLNGESTPAPATATAAPEAPTGPKPVTDPAILAQLNGTGPAPGGEQKPKPSMGSTAFNGALGGATGALVMPWALIGGGAALEATGFGAPVGMAMQAVGGEMLAAQTASVGAAAMSAAGGAVLGAISAPAGQAAEGAATKAGASSAVAGGVGAATELATGVAAGGAWGLTKGMAVDALPGVAKGFMKLYHSWRKGAEDIGETVSAAVSRARASLQDPNLKEQPQHVLHAALQSAAETHSVAAEKVATGIENEARMKAQQILAQGQAQATTVQTQGLENEARIKAQGAAKAGQVRTDGQQAAVATRSENAAEILRIQNKAKAEAQALLDKAHADAAALRLDAAKRQETLTKASDGKSKWAAGILKMMQPKLAAVGEARNPSKIGKDLEDRIAVQKEATDKALEDSDAVLRPERDKAIASEERKGNFLIDSPEMKALSDEMHEVLLTSAKGREASRVTTESGEKVGKARVTETGVKRAFENMQEALKNRRVAVEWDDNGTPTKYETFKTSFEAIDQLRRKLQKAAFGKEAEGYEALGQKLAKTWYNKLAHAQEAYLGEPGPNNIQNKLQTNYKARLEEGEKFKTRMGRVALEQDKTSKMAESFFKDQNGVRDLKELVGSDELVHRAGADYLAGKLQGQDAAYVRKYLSDVKNKDWLDEMPEVKAKAENYLKELESGEALLARRADVAKKLQTRAGEQQKAAGEVGAQAEKAGAKLVGEAKSAGSKLEQEAKAAIKPVQKNADQAAAQKLRDAKTEAQQVSVKARADAAMAKAKADAEAARIKSESAKAAGDLQKQKFAEAKAIRQQAQAKVDAIVKGGTRTEDIEKLINHSPVDQVAAAGKMLAGMPDGQRAWVESVTRVVVKKSPAQLENWWEVRGRDIAKLGGASAADVAKLDAGVAAIAKAANPKIAEQLKKRLGTEIVRAMGAAMGAGIGARALPELKKKQSRLELDAL